MLRAISTLIIYVLFINTALADDQLKQRAQKSKEVVMEFMNSLKGELETAIKAGGPANAINVCHKQAPAIAKTLSDKYGWDIGRTSLKTRNPDNTPDEWEIKILNDFEARKTKGEDVKPMAYFAAVDNNGKKAFRFMKAIPTGEVCLKCHGTDIDPTIKAKLHELYPGDMATGFKLGDIRGAFTISQPM
ncbi:MAG: DUF3365 domain-containing protein [Gammaproteobacteria bacterium]|nr:DUF3365 domain-containing protein [Gammaproteobacteria bacterium]